VGHRKWAANAAAVISVLMAISGPLMGRYRMYVYADHDNSTGNFFHGDYGALQAAGTNLAGVIPCDEWRPRARKRRGRMARKSGSGWPCRVLGDRVGSTSAEASR
jgi:hypothetical protein